MTKEEALQALKEGKKIKHPTLGTHAHLYMQNNTIMVKRTKKSFEYSLQHMNYPVMATGWEIYEGKTAYTPTEMYENMQYYMEYCQQKGYITPQEWVDKYKHF
jgi:hypothetical protein